MGGGITPYCFESGFFGIVNKIVFLQYFSGYYRGVYEKGLPSVHSLDFPINPSLYTQSADRTLFKEPAVSESEEVKEKCIVRK